MDFSGFCQTSGWSMNLTNMNSEEVILPYSLFYAENGTITFDVTHVDGSAQIFADLEIYNNAWAPDPETA